MLDAAAQQQSVTTGGVVVGGRSSNLPQANKHNYRSGAGDSTVATSPWRGELRLTKAQFRLNACKAPPKGAPDNGRGGARKRNKARAC